MARSLTNGARAHQSAAKDEQVQAVATVDTVERALFGKYFPRVFACVYALTGDEETAKDIVSEAFGHTLRRSNDLTEEAFVVELFTTARDLARASRTARVENTTLTGRERELLAFIFDARLTRAEIRRLMRTTERALAATLLRALIKLQSKIAPATLGSTRPI